MKKRFKADLFDDGGCLNMDKRTRKIYVLIMMVLYVEGFDFVLWIYCIEKLLMFISKRSKG